MPRRTPDAASLEALRADMSNHVRAFLAGEQTAQQLDEWLLDTTWNTDLRADPATRQLAGRIGLYLTEYQKGHRADEELRQLLMDALATAPKVR